MKPHPRIRRVPRLLKLVTCPWRLCPELDRFNDAECAAYFDAVGLSRLTSLAAAAVVAVVLGGALLAAGEIAIDYWIPKRWAIVDSDTAVGRAAAASISIMWLTTTVTASLIPYSIVLRRAIRRHLRTAACPSCKYSLLGLTVDVGRVQCPECGREIVLEQFGLRESDLQIGRPDRSDRSPDAAERPGFHWVGWIGVALIAACILGWVALGRHGLLGLTPIGLSLAALGAYQVRRDGTWATVWQDTGEPDDPIPVPPRDGPAD